MRQARSIVVQSSANSCLEAARRLAVSFAEKAAERDRDRVIAYEEFENIRRFGLQAIRVPKDAGGPGCSIAEMSEIVRLLAKGDPNIAQAMSANFIVADSVALWGTSEQRQRVFAAMVNGQIINNAFAERGTTFVGEVRTILSRDGEGYRLNGTKFYSTGALMADQIMIYAKTEDGTPALIILPCDRAGLKLLDDWTGMGQRTTASGTTLLENIRVEAEEVILIPDFVTRRNFFGALAQIVHVAIDTGIALAAMEDAIDFGRTKARPLLESGVKKQTEDPYALYTVGQMAVLVHQSEEMLKRAAMRLDIAVNAQISNSLTATELEKVLIEASIAVAEAKISATESSLRVSEMLYLIGGASATTREYNYDRHWRNARTHTTHDPVVYKYNIVGNYFLGGKAPPISTKV